MSLSNPAPTSVAGLPGRARRDRLTGELVTELSAGPDSATDARIRGELVELNMPVAEALARRYRSRGIGLDDLHQVAFLALTRAVQRFDARSGHALLSYCVPTIRGELRRHFRDHGWMVRPPRRLQELQQSVSRTTEDLTAMLGRPASTEEIASELDEPVAAVREAQAGHGAFTPASLDRPVGDSGTGPNLGDLLEQAPDDRATTDAVEARVVLAPGVRRLSRRDRRILKLRFFDELTQREIAEDIGVTQMQVSRLLSRILRSMRRDIGPLESTTKD